ncbi:MAG TPA: malto-oligosyltrehalose trehalohydrolase [Candidatus Sulfotelmatobacter sp.]|nr:malto-oligosyltrehalose trehalohydrolase [Candidatus Sulfotelmatobacter sp.]
MRFSHTMPLGAELEADGRVRFRLWAPSARTVDLLLANAPEPRALAALPGGWYELTTDAARAGSRYRFLIDGADVVPDPASRFQPLDVDGPGEVIDPRGFDWPDDGWRGRPWHEAVVYELHVGTMSREGTFAGLAAKLDHLQALGVTAIELMPIADFPGARNWGYDGVLPFAPDARYGRPEDLKALIAAAHARGLMVLLDVVYNHFGPSGNFLARYAAPFFTERHRTPWGAAIDFDGPASGPVRSFFIHNALYWLLEYRFDGLRFDAVHAIADDSGTHILDGLAAEVRAAVEPGRQVHLVLENDANEARRLVRDADGRPARYTAQWNDDFHHCCHVLLTGESAGYYADYVERPAERLARCLSEGFAYQGEASAHRDGRRRGEPSSHLPPDAFVAFLQNHDQVGNRALGERLSALVPAPALELARALLLLAPSIPLLFMGEEWWAAEPFPFFCDFAEPLADAVREGRRQEFARFPAFADPATRAQIPDPGADATFASGRLDWSALAAPAPAARLAETRALLALRRQEIVPLLAAGWRDARGRVIGERAIDVEWRFAGATGLRVMANFAADPVDGFAPPTGRCLWQRADAVASLRDGRLAGWGGAWYRR